NDPDIIKPFVILRLLHLSHLEARIVEAKDRRASARLDPRQQTLEDRLAQIAAEAEPDARRKLRDPIACNPFVKELKIGIKHAPHSLRRFICRQVNLNASEQARMLP